MNDERRAVIIIAAVFILGNISGFVLAQAADGVQPVKAAAITADSCPGSYPQGEDKETGAVICHVLDENDKDYSTSGTDPNRPSYDAQGNEYDYTGKLIKPVSQNPQTGDKSVETGDKSCE